MSSRAAAPYDHFDGRQTGSDTIHSGFLCVLLHCTGRVLYFYKYAGATEFAQLTHSTLATTSKTTTILAK